MTEPNNPKWYSRRWVQLIAAGILGLGIGGAGGSADASKQADLAKAAAQRADAAESRVADAEAKAAAAETKAAAADVTAQKKIADELARLAAQKAALDKRAAALTGQEAAAQASRFDGDGLYLVGSDIKPGTYKSAGGENCYWARHNKANDILDNHLGSGPTVVVVRSSDFSLEVSGCAEFRKA